LRESTLLMRIPQRKVKVKFLNHNKPEIGSPMEFTTFVRKPFTVQAIEITTENIHEVAKYIGDVREREDGTEYILVDERLVPNVLRVGPGYYMTKMGENVRCYSRKIFREQFIEEDENIKPWLEFMEKQS
jgi:hypothetical protein